MNVGPLGIVGGAAGSPLQQTQGAEKTRESQDAVNQARQTQSAQKSESASGIGQTEHQEHASDRDADGRRLWEQEQESAEEQSDNGNADSDASQTGSASKDATGERGNQLDLSV